MSIIGEYDDIKIRELESENARLNAALTLHEDKDRIANANIVQCEHENTRLRAALEKYADEGNWERSFDQYGDCMTDLNDLWCPKEHGYTLAQEALKKEGE